MKHILDQHKVNFPDDTKLHTSQVTVQAIINELDAVVVKSEKVWGVDRLHCLVSDATYAKWQMQMEKLNTAISQNDVVMLQELAAGCIRGLQIMEAEARAAGHTPPTKPDAWQVRMGDRVLAIVATEDDALVYQSHLAAGSNVVIWPLPAIARIIGEKYVDWDKQLARVFNPQADTDKHKGAPMFSDDLPF